MVGTFEESNTNCIPDVEYENSVSDLRSTLSMIKHPRFHSRRNAFACDVLQADITELESAVFIKLLRDVGFDIF